MNEALAKAKEALERISANVYNYEREAIRNIAQMALAALSNLEQEPVIRKFIDLPLGTRFRYLGGKDIWVVLERHGCGLVAGYQPHDGWVAGQSICSFADTEEQCKSLEVEVVSHPIAPVAAQEPVTFLCNATRFKLNFNGQKNCTSLSYFADELQGRWVALVPAENDVHMKMSANPCASGKNAKDAERYRWLRDIENGGELSVGKQISACDEYPRYEQVDWLYDEELDAAIDAALAQKGGSNG
jgi:hypothetical protein